MNKDNQRWIEEHYSAKGNFKKVRDDLYDSPELVTVLDTASKLLRAWVAAPCDYPSKQLRKDALQASYEDLDDVVGKVIVKIVMEQTTTLTNIVMSLVGLTDLQGRQAILLAAEVVAVITDSDAYDIYKQGSVIMVVSNIGLDPDIEEHLNQTCYLPPLVTKPKKVTGNWDTPYYTYEGESLILGKRDNFHEGDICLDVINKQNAIPLSLSMDFLGVYQEAEPTFEGSGMSMEANLAKAKAKKAWNKYQSQCSFFVHLLNGMGNKIYLGNKVDKRGRLYCSGYHISPQGNSYRKAVVELYEKHPIDVPEKYRV